MEIDTKMANGGFLGEPYDSLHRDKTLKKKRSFRRLFSVSRTGDHKNRPASPILVSPEFPPAVISAHAITSEQHTAERARQVEPPVTVSIDEAMATANNNSNDMQGKPAFREKSPARAARLDQTVPGTSSSRSSSHTRAASHGTIDTRPARDHHTRTMSENQAIRGGSRERTMTGEPHARTLSGGSVVIGSDGKLSPPNSQNQSPPFLNSPSARSTRNFSRPAGDHRRTASVEEAAPGAQPAARPRRPTYSTRPPPSTLRPKQSYDALLRKHSVTNDTIMEGSATTIRPSTACAETRVVAQEPLKPVPTPEVRDSMRSGWSARSSGLESSNTKHSSVFTKMSSVRDSTTTAGTSDGEGKGGLGGSDTPDLYGGLPIDTHDPHHIRMSFLRGHDISLRTSRIAEAMSEDIVPAPVKHVGSKASSFPAEEIYQKVFPRPPQLREPSESHDQYGFRKSSRDVSEMDYNIWNREYSRTQNRRTSRWVSLMKSSGLPINDPVRFPLRSEKVQRYVRKGVPPMWRGAMWFFYAGGQSYLDKFPDLYTRLVVDSKAPRLNENDKEAIDRDINRTFPDNLHFKPDPPLPEGQESLLISALRRVLYAFAVHHPKIGYCQSLNFLTGMLLLFLDEEKTFWMLHIITARYLPGTHEISLEGANVDLWVLMLALKEGHPKIWTKIGGEKSITPLRLPPVSLCTTPWFMSLFIGAVPVETVLRIWDTLFYDGSTVIFRSALAIFRLSEPDILRVHDPMETFQVVQGLPKKMLDAATLIMTANRKGCVSSTWVEARRKERKEFYAQERAAEQARRQSRDFSGMTGDRNLLLSPMPPRPETAVRKLSSSKSVTDLSTEPAFKGVLMKKPSKGVLTKRPPSRKQNA